MGSEVTVEVIEVHIYTFVAKSSKTYVKLSLYSYIILSACCPQFLHHLDFVFKNLILQIPLKSFAHFLLRTVALAEMQWQILRLVGIFSQLYKCVQIIRN